MQLLLSNLPPRIEPTVLLFEDGSYAEELRERGFSVEVVALQRDLMAVRREEFPLMSVFAALMMLPRLMRAIRRVKPHVVYTNTVKAHILGAVAGRLAGYRVVSHYRDILGGRANTALRVIGFLCTKRRVAISKAVAEAIALPETVVVPNPVDLCQYKKLPSAGEARGDLGLPLGVSLVAIIGRINRWKGHDRFLRIAKIVAESSDAHFVIVGKAMFRDADFQAELSDLAVSLGISERVHNVPWLSDPCIAYAAIDVNCNTSRAEPFGRTIIEAAACGVPTVVFNEGGAPEAIGDGLSGRVVPRNDEAAFANAILELLASDRHTAALNSRKHALLFDATLHAERIAMILDQVGIGNGSDGFITAAKPTPEAAY